MFGVRDNSVLLFFTDGDSTDLTFETTLSPMSGVK